jgi:hypothetical protein
MFKKLFMLFKIGRKLSLSGAISSIYEIYDIAPDNDNFRPILKSINNFLNIF